MGRGGGRGWSRWSVSIPPGNRARSQGDPRAAKANPSQTVCNRTVSQVSTLGVEKAAAGDAGYLSWVGTFGGNGFVACSALRFDVDRGSARRVVRRYCCGRNQTGGLSEGLSG